MSLAAAREAWRQARQDVQHGRDPTLARKHDKPATDFETVAKEWLRRDQAHNRSYPEVKRVLDREILPAWGHRQVDQLTRRDVLDLIDGIADRGAVVMARRVQAYVHRFFRWAAARGIIDVNPAANLPKPGSEAKRDRVLSDVELVAVWRGAGQLGWPFGTAVQLLILTAARREEIGQLRWSELDLNHVAIRLKGERTKNNEPRDIPLAAPAWALLQGVPRVADSDFVFSTNRTTAISGWSRAKRQLDALAPIASWRLHDLRRSVATGLQRLGISLQTIEAVLGHVGGSRSGIVGVYQRHSFDAEKRVALEAWGRHVTSLIEGKDAGNVVSLARVNSSGDA
jgi:integrase